MRKSALILAASIALVSAAYAEQPIPLQELQDQLAIAHTRAEQARARYSCVRDAIEARQHATDLVIRDRSWRTSCFNSVIYKLQEENEVLSMRLELWMAKHGSSSEPVTALRSRMTEIYHRIEDERFRDEQIYKTEYETALAREKLLQEFVEGFGAQPSP